MLADYRIEQERWARQRRERQQLARAFGYFIATLAQWDWFINPLTMRAGNFRENAWERGELRREGNLAVWKPDPRLAKSEPNSRFSRVHGPPTPAVAIVLIQKWFREIEKTAGKPIGWMIAEEFGRSGGRWHCHALITGVSHLYRKNFWREAHRRFGYTRIEPFDPARGAAFYTAKYAGRSLGEIHFGGTLGGVDLQKCESSSFKGGCQDVAPSVALPKELYHLTLPWRHR